MKTFFNDVIGLVGVACFSYGAMLIYFPLVFIVSGLFAIAFAVVSGAK